MQYLFKSYPPFVDLKNKDKGIHGNESIIQVIIANICLNIGYIFASDINWGKGINRPDILLSRVTWRNFLKLYLNYFGFGFGFGFDYDIDFDFVFEFKFE